MANTIRVTLSPTPGFCVKSTALQDALCPISSRSEATPTTNVSSLSESAIPGTISISKGLKIFVNIAWDANVPPPPEGSEDVIQKAMRGEDELDENAFMTGGGWFVPVVVSEPRQDTDKAGKLSAVFDCVYNLSLKSRALRDPDFKTFLIELAFQRIEAQSSGLLLSRQIGTPNIASKGKLNPRSVLIPLQLYPVGHPARPTADSTGSGESKTRARKLIEEIEPPKPRKSASSVGSKLEAKLKGILKTPSANSEPSPKAKEDSLVQNAAATAAPAATPAFSWRKAGEDSKAIQITIQVPKLTHSHIPKATLDLEPRRLLLSIPSLYALDLDMDMLDAQFPAAHPESAQEALTLKRQRDLDVEGARAEWRVAEGILVVNA